MYVCLFVEVVAGRQVNVTCDELSEVVEDLFVEYLRHNSCN